MMPYENKNEGISSGMSSINLALDHHRGGDLPDLAITLLPIAEPPFILGSAAAFRIWSAAVALSHSLYS